MYIYMCVYIYIYIVACLQDFLKFIWVVLHPTQSNTREAWMVQDPACHPQDAPWLRSIGWFKGTSTGNHGFLRPKKRGNCRRFSQPIHC